MSTLSGADEARPGISSSPSPPFVYTQESFLYVVNHVFHPFHLSDKFDYPPEGDLSLVRAAHAVAHTYYSTHVSGTSKRDQWRRVTKMLGNLLAHVQSGYSDINCVISQLRGMEIGDVLTYSIQYLSRTTGVLVTKRANSVLCEAFQVPSFPRSPLAHVPATHSFPESTVEIPNNIFDDEDFQSELCQLLCNVPFHFSAPDLGVLHGTSVTMNVSHITKQIHDSFEDSRSRSPLWLVIRVAIQMVIEHSLGRPAYKSFMLFFKCTLTKEECNTSLSRHHLHFMSYSILRRLNKLGSSTPNWLSAMALDAYTHLREILDAMWEQQRVRLSPFQNPSPNQLIRDTRLSLRNSREYVNKVLKTYDRVPVATPFCPNHHCRGTLHDFLSSNRAFSEEAYHADPVTALFDIERSVEESIDDWVASVCDVEGACSQLAILLKEYVSKVEWEPLHQDKHLERLSARRLTVIELCVALDKLILKEVPLLANYPPIISIDPRELFLCKSTNLHRLSRAVQYFSARHSQSRCKVPVLSDRFTEESFPIRYYDQSPPLQQLKAQMDEYLRDNQPCMQGPSQPLDTGTSQSTLPTSLLHAKVVVFELQCPPCVRIWRSTLVNVTHLGKVGIRMNSHNVEAMGIRLVLLYCPLSDVFTSQPPYRCQPRDVDEHILSKYPDPLANEVNLFYGLDLSGSLPRLRYFQTGAPLCCTSGSWVDLCASSTHTSNHILATQADCPSNLSPNEFITNAHLRCGGSLQWLNILHGLRARTLNLRCEEVYSLLFYATTQVGPFDSDTGVWIWHQELQDSTFCITLLVELEELFTEAGSSSMDSVLLKTISLLLTRVLASSPSGDVSTRVIELLRNVRRKTFTCVQDLSYDLVMAPPNEERISSLLQIATAYQSMVDVDHVTLYELIRSPEDVDALLSCSILIRALSARRAYQEPPSLHNMRDSHLSLTLEKPLKTAILADPSDYGIDLAIARIFTNHRPGMWRWEQLQRPNDRWLACEVKANVNECFLTAHVDLLSGELRVAGQPLGNLPDEIRELLPNLGFLKVPSNISGMDFVTLDMMSKHRLHFSLRDNVLVLRTQRDEISDPLVLIPSHVLYQDLPTPLVDKHVHLLNPSANLIEIRPVHQLWEGSSSHWRIDLASGSCRRPCGCGSENLVDVSSQTWAMLSECFECLHTGNPDEMQDLIITSSIVDSTSALRLSVTLPQFNLSFFVNEMEELESRDFEGMVYDEDQSVEALFGLETLLVVRPKTHFSGAHLIDNIIPRRILARHGFRELRNENDPEKVRVGGVGESYHTYSVDTELGCLLAPTRSTHGENGCPRSALPPAVGRSSIDHEAQSWIPYPTKYPHIRAACEEVESRWYWTKHRPLSVRHEYTSTEISRAAYLFPSMATLGGQDSDPRDSGDFRSASSELEPRSTLQTALSPVAHLFNAGSPTQVGPDYLMHKRLAPKLADRILLLRDSITALSEEISALDQIFSHPSILTNHSLQQEYIPKLRASAQYLRTESRMSYRVKGKDRVETLKNHYQQCRSAFCDSLKVLQERLGPTMDPYEQAHFRFGQWPSTTAISLLRYLSSTSLINISSDWRECLTSLALLLLDLQRSRRLLQFALGGLEEDLLRELENEGCDGWRPEEYPDRLLIQIQGNFLIRRSQAEAAMEIMSPQSGQSTVIQVNMGEGKSSVIIPIVAAALADGRQLVRVVVPKVLRVQMFDLLVARLGGLANRAIYHLPCSRAPKYNLLGDHEDQLPAPGRLMRQCMAERGILLVQPEHVVSLKLKTAEAQLLNSSPAVSQRESASQWLDLQKWIDSHVRDVLDESDEILHPRFQLIYTLGPNQHMDGYPERWTITQQVLQLAREHLYSFSKHAPDSIQYECGQPGSFPHIHILQSSNVCQQHLILSITEDVLAGRLRGLPPFEHLSPALQDAIRSFISDKGILQIPDTAKRVEEYAKDSEQGHLWSALLLLRGLLTTDILLFALSKRRWRVDYGLISDSQSSWADGLGPHTTMLAVPYRAKDVPAPNTQFGHPDLTIILTCLSYYYTGLSEKQVRTSFTILLDQDDPSTEYALWIKPYDQETFPDSLRKPTDLILFPSERWDKVIYPMFHRNQAVIDFYLSRFVFPREAKEYPWKLPASSWDLAEKREKLVTGFSGTNDSRWLLPLSIAQHDLSHEMGTNARVLEYLLRPENGSYIMAHDKGERLATLAFLQLVTTQCPKIRILLDVGAQVLDIYNEQVVKAWLDIVLDASDGVYFDENDELRIITRNGNVQRMSSSALSKRSDQCVVYLDHAHTRGTDLKFPVESRAAVTLGPKVTKDALVQGCMRMRRLGHGHSVMFFAPPSIDRNIRAVVFKTDSNTPLTTADIVCWAIQETWADIQRRAPYWAQQGMNHRSRYNAWSRFVHGEFTTERLLDAWCQLNLKSLSALYGASATKDTSDDLSLLDSDIRQRCKALGILSLPSAQMDEEQEREVHREREREREVELPPLANPKRHFIHPAVFEFVKTGLITALHFGHVFLPVSGMLKAITGSLGAPETIRDSRLLATVDFCTTVEPQSTVGTMDQYLRPIQWILSSDRDHNRVLVILSPFEADWLMPSIRTSQHVHLHLYAPRTSKRMKPSDDLQLYAIPPLPADWTPPWDLIDQLNVFSGQLYLRDYGAYIRLCRLLGMSATRRDQTWNDPATRQSPPFDSTRKETGLKLVMVKALLAIRNRGLPLAHTHMGRILMEQVLTEKDFLAGGSLPLMPLEELSEYYQTSDPFEAMEVDEVLEGRCQRQRNVVDYDDGSSDDSEEWTTADEGDEDLQELAGRSRATKGRRASNKLKESEISGRSTPASETDGGGRKAARKGKAKVSDHDTSSVNEEDDEDKDSKRRETESQELPGAVILKRLGIFYALHAAVLRAYEDIDGWKRRELFCELPDRRDYPDYYTLIRQPIALFTIDERISHGHYETITQYKEDWQLMFDNARTYNQEGSWVHIDTDEMEKVFHATLARLTAGIDLPGAAPFPSETAPSRSGSHDYALTPIDEEELGVEYGMRISVDEDEYSTAQSDEG